MYKNIITIVLGLLLISAASHASDEWADDFAWNVDTAYYPWGDYLTWTIDESDLTLDINSTQSISALTQAMQTWDDVADANYDFWKQPDQGGDYDFLEGSGWDPYYSNITFGGWLDSTAWSDMGANANNLAVAWPFTVRDGNNQRVDYDMNGYWDLAHVSIFFNDSFEWSTDGSSNTYDIQTVATHEIGHALGLKHSPAGVNSVMVGITSPGEVLHDLFAWDIEQVETIYPQPPAIPEPSAMILFAFGFILKYFSRKRHTK